ncbi:MAG: cobalamin-dependent protein, partial [Planctomycetota bacterium]
MKITLISPYATISAFGLRSISACLKGEGHDVKLIFLPKKSATGYEEETLNELTPLVQGSHLIGISLMTNYFDNVIQLTQKLKQIGDTPIIWGGIHATIRPEECLNMADMVCLGEGEESILELTRKMQKGENY